MCSIFNPTFIVFLLVSSVLFSLFLLVNTNRKTSFEPGILRQGLPLYHSKFADWIITWVVHLPELTETGGPFYRIGLDCGLCVAAIPGLSCIRSEFWSTGHSVIKRWPANLAIPSLRPAVGGIFPTVNGVALYRAFQSS